ncbi:MAG TPA: hypothetical protein VET26_00005, partial [Candidatus Sulfotelmatobacter sp.]|nr:hypothetical protein [Candidatus Sulfotelmatobacter sp.]
LILCVASGLVALWFAASVTFGSGGALRFATLTVVGLSGARALFSPEPAMVMTAVAAMALAIAVASSAGGGTPGALPFVAAALIAAGVMAVPKPASNDS